VKEPANKKKRESGSKSKRGIAKHSKSKSRSRSRSRSGSRKRSARNKNGASHSIEKVGQKGAGRPTSPPAHRRNHRSGSRSRSPSRSSDRKTSVRAGRSKSPILPTNKDAMLGDDKKEASNKLAAVISVVDDISTLSDRDRRGPEEHLTMPKGASLPVSSSPSAVAVGRAAHLPMHLSSDRITA